MPVLSRVSISSSLLAVMLMAGGCSLRDASRTAPLVGAWRSSIRFESGTFAEAKELEFMYAFHADGTMTESSNYDAAPPVPPAYGVWRTIGPTEFEATYEFFSTAPTAPDAFKSGAGWLPSGRGVLTERITLSDDGNTFTSTLTYEALDHQGKPVQGGGNAKGRAVRIRL